MTRPRLLDLFCGAGGAAVGYHRAGFDVVGVDIRPQSHYPFPFVQGDALAPPVRLEDFDVIHASPPCQDYTPMSNRWGSSQPRLIDQMQEILAGHLYVIENVVGSGLPYRLCGKAFGLSTERHRLFASSVPIWATPCAHDGVNVRVYGDPDGRRVWTRTDDSEARAWASLAEGRAALDVPWMETSEEIREAIPPAYTEYIGAQILEHLLVGAAKHDSQSGGTDG